MCEGVPVGAGGGSKEQEVPSSQQSCSVLGGGDWGEEAYGDSLHQAKFEDKEFLISNKAEHLRV